MKITVSNKTTIIDAPSSLEREIWRRLTIENPAYLEAEKRGRWTGNIDSHVCLYDQPDTGVLEVPRGFTSGIAKMANRSGIPYELEDQTRCMEPVDFHFDGTLRDYQQLAASEVHERRFGVVSLPTAAGKTVLALYIIAERKQPALVVVHTKELLKQWIERTHEFLGIPVEEIGIIGDGQKRIGDRITIAMVQTLYKCKDDVAPVIGHLVVDECHRCPSKIFTEAVTAFDSKFMLGLTATALRRDGLTKLIYWHLGDRVYTIDQKELTDTGAILPFRVKWVKTDFTTSLDPSGQYSAMLSELTQDLERNRRVGREAAEQAKTSPGIVLVLSDRKEHCRLIAEALDRDHGIASTILTGDLSNEARERVTEKLKAGDCKVLVATGQLIGEGFDLPALGAVLLTTPIRFEGRLIQFIGRALRPSPGQDHAVVVDFVDVEIGVLKSSARKRLAVYRNQGAIGCESQI
jgi:superfamily II DNA or RNA helicase